MDNIVLETDAAPQPFKAKRENWTEPRHLRDIARKLAELKGASIEQVEAATTANLLNMVGGDSVGKYVHVHGAGPGGDEATP